MKPLAIDLFAGLGGWASGLLTEGWDVIGFDIERHVYGEHRYPAQLVIQDVLTLDGSQFRDAALIVASPPCQAYSYRAMPWKRAKALPPPDNTLFQACFRIQCEASAAAGRHIPLIVENVRGAQRWIGQARWHFGSYFLWGDIPALMPITPAERLKFNPDGTQHPPGSWFKIANSKNRGAHIKNAGGSWFNVAHNTTSGKGQNPVNGTKAGGDWFGTYAEQKALGTISPGRLHGKNSVKRKAAAAQIAKIPFPLAQHIARVFKPVSPHPATPLAGPGPSAQAQGATRMRESCADVES